MSKRQLEALEALFSCEKQRVTGVAHLTERGIGAKLKKLTITHLTQDMLLLHIDSGRRGNKSAIDCMSPLFTITGAFAHNRACDTVLVREIEGTYQIYYIELKSNKPSDYAGQFKSTKCFFRYVREILKDLYEVDMTIGKERYVIFHTDPSGGIQSVRKTRSRPSAEDSNSPSSPDMYVVRDESTIECTQFLRSP